MNRFSRGRAVFWCVLTSLLSLVSAASFQERVTAQESYERHPDSLRKDGVPRGTVQSFSFSSSEIYPGTEREYFVYVPAQYKPDQPAALMVFQDGRNYVREKGGWQVPVVFDNLIAAGDMPVTIAVCVNPGVVAAGDENQNRFNRSFEYDTVSDRYARFLIDELLPEVAKKYSITDDPNRRGIGGSSSGAIAAFGVAWHRPDQFRRVFSTIGTYVGLRGGNEYPTLIRKTEPKPLKVFLQDGSNDLNIYGGSWWNANLTMLSALQWAGYDVKHVWGEGGHNSKHGVSILPDAMRWLWQDHEQAIEADYGDHPEMDKRFEPDADWELVSEGHGFTEGPAVSPTGEVYFCDVRQGEIYRVSSPEAEQPQVRLHGRLEGVSGLMFDAEGNLYCACNRTRRLVRIDPDNQPTVLARDVGCNDLVVLDHGVYFTSPDEKCVRYLPLGPPDAKPIKVGVGPERPNGLIVTPDRRFLHVVDSAGRYVWSYRIEDDGRLSFGQPYGYLHLPQDQLSTGADGATMTVDGSLVVASELGLQIFDQPGRVHVITSRPTMTGKLTNCVFAGADFNTLYVTVGGNVYRRKTKMVGDVPWRPAQTPPRPRL
jgi:sugar lactone lactonase YvrE/enterochelin esterase-like enzyme